MLLAGAAAHHNDELGADSGRECVLEIVGIGGSVLP